VNPERQKIITVDKRQNFIDELSASLATEDCVDFRIHEIGMVS